MLMIFDDPPCDIGLEMSDGVLDGSDVMVCAEKPPHCELDDRVTSRLEYGSLLNLPRASSSIEAVVWVPRELESDIAPFALREIFRVLKPGGELILAALGESGVWTWIGRFWRLESRSIRVSCRQLQSTFVPYAKMGCWERVFRPIRRKRLSMQLIRDLRCSRRKMAAK